MKKTLFITSALAVLAAAPAMADEQLPQTGNLMDGKTYTAGCVSDVLGSTTGPVTADPNYVARTYTCTAGKYMIKGNSWAENYASGSIDGAFCGTCPANSYCDATLTTNHVYSDNPDDTTDLGITSCSTATGGDYTLSDGGSNAETDCYRDCAANDVPNLKDGGTTTGKYYSAAEAGVHAQNMCAPADENQCAPGYTYTAGTSSTPATCVANQVHVYFTDEDSYLVGSTTCTYDGTLTTAAEPVKKGYTFTGWTFAPTQGEIPTERPQQGN